MLSKRILIIVLLLLFAQIIFSQDALTIVRKLDKNEVYDSIKFEGEMTIYLSGKKYIKTFYSYAKGDKNFFTEFTNPDDEGTKYLKKEGNLYVYSPESEKIIPITGHMLKESMMGSDMSYEDTINNETLESRYNAAIINETEYNNKKVWVLELTAKKKTETYYKQKIWVDKETFNGVKVEQYSISGVKLKETSLLEIKKINDRFFPTIIEVKDLQRKDSKTLFTMTKIELDIVIPDSMFSFKKLQK